MVIYAKNKKAAHDYFILDKYEAGIVLSGLEVKGIRSGKISLKESYVRFIKNELFLLQAHISPPSNIASWIKYNPIEKRKLLLHKKQLNKLKKQLAEKGYTLTILDIYQPTHSKKIKVTLALVKGKKNYDKKIAIKEKDLDREAKKQLKYF